MSLPARLLPLQSAIQRYDWGSTTAIPKLLGVAPDGEPQAELWLGAHPMAPSQADVGGTTALRWRPLDRLVAEEPLTLLGQAVVDRFGPRLPFLVKVLAAARPLSLQTHPTLAQAREGYAREEARAISRRAPERTYRDRNHKPELLVALTPFDVLCGFRAPADSARLFDALADAGAAGLRPWAARLGDRAAAPVDVPTGGAADAPVDGTVDAPADASTPAPAEAPADATVDDLHRAAPGKAELMDTFWALWDLEPAACEALVGQTGQAAARLAARPGPWQAVAAWTVRLAEASPADAGVIVALLMNLLRLTPGQGLFVPAGRLHAYLEGVGMEVMASSDNVIRGGLTTKHVDLAELELVLDVRPEVIEPQAGTPFPGGVVYRTPAPDFRVMRLDLPPGAHFDATPQGPEILFCAGGHGRVEGLALEAGTALFVPAASGPYTLVGPAVIWRVTVGPAETSAPYEIDRRSRIR